MSEHSEGPWHVGKSNNNSPAIRAADRSLVAVVNVAKMRDQRVANAFLLAAAPSMLAALLAAKAFGAQGETHEGISVSYLIQDAIERATAGGP